MLVLLLLAVLAMAMELAAVERVESTVTSRQLEQLAALACPEF
ncbi:hypothetical protein [Pseudomonas chlororaphis]|nr:hypothetical protein [Pseudomonas chlororaphis]WDH24116.1 hypothetical protein PUP50_07475 [Pseudomonas chlororaphis]